MTGIDVQTIAKAFPVHKEEGVRLRHDRAAPENIAASQALAATDFLTCVELFFLRRRADYRLRFGAPSIFRRLDNARALAFFKPGKVFGYLCWRAVENGAEHWRFAILEARAPWQSVDAPGGEWPEGEALLIAAGAAKVKRALLQIDVLEAAGFDPAAVSPDYYRYLHDRIEKAEPVRVYSRGEHDAFLQTLRCG